MGEILLAVIMFAIAAAAFILSIRAFREKGFLLNNAWIYATEQQRETMDKKPYYRQSAVAFALVGIIFALNGLAVLLEEAWISRVVIILAVLAVIYAISSSVAIEKRKKQ